MKIVIIVLGIIICYLLIDRFRIKHALKQLNIDMENKKNNFSNGLLTQIINDSSLSGLIIKINDLFENLSLSQRKSKKEKEEFKLVLHNLAHDIRTPLTIANGYVQDIMRKSDNETEKLVKVSQNLMLVSKRLEILLEYQTVQENSALNLEIVNLTKLVKKIILNYYDSFSDKNFDVILNFPEIDYYIKGDIEVLERIFQNLLGNVLKHGQNKLVLKLINTNGKISVTIENESQQTITAVDKLANRFYSENFSEIETSSGLGLFIVKELVEKLQGDLKINYLEPNFITVISWNEDKKRPN